MTRPKSASVNFFSRLLFYLLLACVCTASFLFSLAVGLIVIDLHQYEAGHREWKQSFYAREGSKFVNRHPRMAKHSFSADKKDGVFRIFFVGDSSVIGWPYIKRQTVLFPGLSLNTRQAGIACWMELALGAAGVDAEIINAGMEWGTVADEAKLVSEIAEIGAPDAIIFMSGHSEGINLFPDRYCPPEQNLEQALGQVSRGFEDGLDKIIASAKTAQVPLLLLTQPINLRSWYPEDFDGSVDHRKINELLFAGKVPEAREILLKEKDRKSPMRFNLLGRTFLATGDSLEARRYFLAANDLSRKFMSTRTMWNDMILRKGAAQGAERDIENADGILLQERNNFKISSSPQAFDFAAEFYRNSPDGLPGMDVFLDNCHFNLNGQRLAADIIARFVLKNFFGKDAARAELKPVKLSLREQSMIKNIFRIAKFNIVRYRFLRFVLGLRTKRMPLAEDNNLQALYENYTNRINEYTKSLKTDRLN